MKIKYIRVKNFLAVADGPFEIDFTKYGNIVQIRGKNLDYGEDHSNGSGKSLTSEAIVYGLYGKLIKGLNHKEAINAHAKRGLEVVIHFDINKDEYKIIRRRDPNELQLWKNGEELTLGGIPATQGLINDIVGLSCDAFTNVVCFGQHNEKGFLRCTAAEKRAIAENLLSLDKYVRYHKIANDRRRMNLDKIERQKELYQSSSINLVAAEKRRNTLKAQHEQWLAHHANSIKILRDKISSSMLLKEQNAPQKNYDEDLAKVDTEILNLENMRMRLHSGMEKMENSISARREAKQNLAIEVSNIDKELVLLTQDIGDLAEQIKKTRSIALGNCPVCYSPVTQENVTLIIDHVRQKISDRQEKYNLLQSKGVSKKSELREQDNALTNLLNTRKDARDKEVIVLNDFNRKIQERNALGQAAMKAKTTAVAVMEKELEHLQDQLKVKMDDKSPYLDLIIDADQELLKLAEEVGKRREEIAELEKKMPYLDFWVRAFGDDGIRSFVISEITPALNARINYWLQFLIENKVEMQFNNHLEECIKPINGDPFVYNALSGGEHQRIDLSIALGFSHVMILTSGACPSIVILDEIGTNLDRPGIYAVYNTICELARDRQVFVITHHPVLQELLANYDTIDVIRESGMTKISN